jgi:hypothetical protein
VRGRQGKAVCPPGLSRAGGSCARMSPLQACRVKAGLAIAVLVFVHHWHDSSALTNPVLWSGTVPVLAYDGRGPEMLPSALLEDTVEVFQSTPELPSPGSPSETLVPYTRAESPEFEEAVANLPRVDDLVPVLDTIELKTLSSTQRHLIEEGQRISDNIELLRSQLADQTTAASAETLREFWKGYDRLQDIQTQFSDQFTNHSHALQPLLADVVNQVGKSLAPLKHVVDSCSKHVSNEMTKMVLGSAVTEAVASLQALTGLAALVDVADVVGRIKSTCSDESRTCVSMKKALQHLNRAESDVVSAQSALDRIVSDALANRPLENKDVNLFSVEQHDLAVQLANVRSNLDSAHAAVSRDVTMLGHRATRWGIISILLALAGNVASNAPGVLGPLQGVSFGATVSASALSLLGKIFGSRRLDRLAAMQGRHDTALTEHAALQAQFSQVEAPAAQPLHVKNAQPIYVHSGNVRQQLKQLAANVYDASASIAEGGRDAAQGASAITAFRELISGLSCIRAQTPGPAGEAEEDTVRALLPLLDTLAAAQEGNATAQEAQQAVNRALDLVRQRIERGDNATPATRRGPTPGPARSRRSGLRPPSVAPRTPAPQSLTPPPVGELGVAPCTSSAGRSGSRSRVGGGGLTARTSRLRPPSVAPRDMSRSPPPLPLPGTMHAVYSMTPGLDMEPGSTNRPRRR